MTVSGLIESDQAVSGATGPRRGLHVLLALAGALAFVGFVALGNWQLERLEWKRGLIEQVESRVGSPAEEAPQRARWAAVNRQDDEYRHVTVAGEFLSELDTLVVAATELGSGYWVVTPLRRVDGDVVLINRGYIAQGVEPVPPPKGEVRISGLLRITEPGGSVLRDNDPMAGRWYSRDVAAIAAARGIEAAPYFIDAAANQAGSPGGAGPVGGLTVLRFHNNHLVYALTWYGLALMVVAAGVLVWRESRKVKKRGEPREPRGR